MIVLHLTPSADLPGGRISRLSFAPDGRTLAAIWRREGNLLGIVWWDLHTRSQIAAEFGSRLMEDNFTPPDPALSSDHRLLARMENDRGGSQRLVLIDRSRPKVKAHHLTAWPFLPPDEVNFQLFTALAFAPSGEHLYALVTSGDPEPNTDPVLGVYRWPVLEVLAGKGKKSAGHLLPNPNFIRPIPQPTVFGWAHFGPTLAVSTQTIIAGHWDKQILGWSLPGGDPLPPMGVTKKRKQPISWRLAVSPDGQTLAAADETVTLFDLTTGKPRRSLPAGPVVSHPGLPSKCRFVFDLAYHPAGDVLATAHGDARVRWWDVARGTERACYDCGAGGVTAVAFSSDGLLAAAGGSDGQVVVWDVV